MYMTEIGEFRVTHQRNWYLSCTLKEVCQAEKDLMAFLAKWLSYEKTEKGETAWSVQEKG